LVPFYWQVAMVFIFGSIIGSFLNVVLYRLHTGKSLAGHSHCLSCGHNLTALELVPLLSYVGLRGRCFSCRSYIPARYFLVELLTGCLFVTVWLVFVGVVPILLAWLVVAALVVVAVYDLRHFIIPDELVLALLVLALAQNGYYLWLTNKSWLVVYNLLGAGLGAAFFFLIWHFSKGKWIGFGDVKLAFPLGLLVGYVGVFSMIALAFWVGAAVSLLLLLGQHLAKRGQLPLRFRRYQLTMKSAVPFAPFLIIGFLLVWLWQIDAIALLTYGG